MEPCLLPYLGNNLVPSDAEIHKAKTLRMTSLTSLSTVHTEANTRTIALTRNLKARITTLRNSIHECDIILSPIRHLPADVLREIFSLCLVTHRNPCLSIHEAPLLLIRVCSAWRGIALTYPRLWARLHIQIPGYYPDAPELTEPTMHLGKVSRANHVKRLKNCGTAVQEWLNRSGSYTLSISVVSTSHYLCLSDNANLMVGLVDTIISFSHRWHEFELNVSIAIYPLFHLRLSPDSVPLLRDLRVSSPDGLTASMFSDLLRGLMSAPDIRTISTAFADYNLNNLRRFPVPSNWAQSTHLYLQFPVRQEWIFDILKQCRNLVACKFVVVIFGDQDAILTPKVDLPLPFLKFLSVNAISQDWDPYVTRIFDYVQAPLLQTIEHHTYPRVKPTVLSPLISMLQRSKGTLKKLSIDPGTIPSEMIECLREAESVVHLVYGTMTRPLYVTPHDCPPEDIDLSIFGPSNTPQDSSIAPGCPTSKFLLPNLEVFEAFEVGHLTDEILIEFIVSRLDPTQKGCARLKRVHVQFQKKGQTDIASEVLRRIGAVGISDFKLDVSYFDDLPRIENVTWKHHVDIDIET
ncbi:hypothetical protein B0H34DRAFT_722225 [Crassisporium funariophilum]|nr:hypothetical protein B0H34DRAFT_722225 [Crassisporium funariophilum]